MTNIDISLLEKINELQNYPMPRTRATSTDVAEQRQQWVDRARLYLADLMERGRAFNDIAPVTDKLDLGEFSDVMSDAVDEIKQQFDDIEQALEEEEQAA